MFTVNLTDKIAFENDLEKYLKVCFWHDWLKCGNTYDSDYENNLKVCDKKKTKKQKETKQHDIFDISRTKETTESLNVCREWHKCQKKVPNIIIYFFCEKTY